MSNSRAKGLNNIKKSIFYFTEKFHLSVTKTRPLMAREMIVVYCGNLGEPVTLLCVWVKYRILTCSSTQHPQ
jgi:hypothetical protein